MGCGPRSRKAEKLQEISVSATQRSKSDPRPLKVTRTYRYAKGAELQAPMLDGHPNYHHFTVSDGGIRTLLESGINRPALVAATDGPRYPVIGIRSSPWKAGHSTNPWHDIFDIDHGYVRYFGDHKADSTKALGQTPGNRALLADFEAHRGATAADRLRATPLMLFRAVTVLGRPKGHVQFCGVAVMERLEHVVQRSASGESFPNFVFDLAVLELAAEEERVDWRWIDDRRDLTLSVEETLRFAPASWKRWIAQGDPVLPSIRRRVATNMVTKPVDQRPAAGTAEEAVLQSIYHHFDGRKHAFELLASRVTGSLMRERGGAYQEGWITRGSGDGGADFIGRFDVGSGDVSTPLVILGQAKCVSPSASISAEQIARVVARLRRGWLGVYVTTGVFSEKAQLEIIDDQYPILLIGGGRLAEEVRRMALAAHGGDVAALLTEVLDSYPKAISSRRPEEILFQ